MELVNTSSTAKGADMAANDDEGAAICSKSAAEEFGLEVLREGVQDNHTNETKFIVIVSAFYLTNFRDEKRAKVDLEHL